MQNDKVFDFGPSLLDEMDFMFRSMTTSGDSSSLNPPLTPNFDNVNKRNELTEINAKLNRKAPGGNASGMTAGEFSVEILTGILNNFDEIKNSFVTSFRLTNRLMRKFKIFKQTSTLLQDILRSRIAWQISTFHSFFLQANFYLISSYHKVDNRLTNFQHVSTLVSKLKLGQK